MHGGLCIPEILQSIAFSQHFLPSSKVSSKFWSWKFFQHSFRVQRRRRVRTYIRRQSKNVWDLKLTQLKGIKWRVSRDFRLQTFFVNSFLQPPDFLIRAVSNHFNNSRRYSQLKVQGGKWKKSSIRP